MVTAMKLTHCFVTDNINYAKFETEVSYLFLIKIKEIIYILWQNGYNSGWDQGWSWEPGKGYLCT